MLLVNFLDQLSPGNDTQIIEEKQALGILLDHLNVAKPPGHMNLCSGYWPWDTYTTLHYTCTIECAV